ncbi:L-fuculokinase [Thaumasiovibrio sp. DFM-14]|uniref:L-fuculokinase n=1 Tax=Thaumasiovibrio sp. DFM-14 TaxID=3384792 RepID=UPI00399F9F56
MSIQDNAVLILDCGATNVRAIVIDSDGSVLASHHIANETHVDAHTGFHHWDTEQIWEKFCICSHQIQGKIDVTKIVGIAVTTFGVDGAPFDLNQQQMAPVIAWKCPRTLDVMQKLKQYLDPATLYQRNGIGDFSFNTLYKLIWIKENQPDLFKEMDKFVFISSIFTHRLTGRLTTDYSMAGTSMLTDLSTRDWCNTTLDALGLNKTRFPPLVEAGQTIGPLLPSIAKQLNLPAGLPVISAGHDTQFAILGSGAAQNQPVLSSGTWEILMARVEQFSPPLTYPSPTMTTEFDADKQLLNPGIQWLSSGILEPLMNTYFPSLVAESNRYQTIIEAAQCIPAGSNGVQVTPHFVPSRDQAWHITGLQKNTPPEAIYRAALEALAVKLNHSLSELETRAQFKTKQLLCVGGGTKNRLWNQIRADILNLPIHIVNEPETTAIGAAMTAFYGLGQYTSLEEAQKNMAPEQIVITPATNMSIYQQMNIHTLHPLSKLKEETYV